MTVMPSFEAASKTLGAAFDFRELAHRANRRSRIFPAPVARGVQRGALRAEKSAIVGARPKVILDTSDGE